MYILPFSLLISTIASIIICLRTPPEKDEVLESFYLNVRPWGVWKPVHEKLIIKNPNLQKNLNFRRDAFNVGVGIIWQLNLMVVPICIVIRQYTTLVMSIVVLAITSIIMKFTWYDKLGTDDMYISQNK
jgi:hypothetical protein